MSYNYAPIATKALKLIAKYGVAMTLRQNVGGVFNPATGTRQGTQTDTPCQGIIDNYSVEIVNGTSVLTTDQRIFVAAASLAVIPTGGDQILVNGLTFDIVNVNIIGPGNTVILWDIQGRQ